MKKQFTLLSLTLLLSIPVFAQGIFSAVQENDIAGIRYLLNRGVNINSRDNKGVTPLIIAVIEKQERACAYLVEREAGLNCRTKPAIPP